MSKKNHIQDLKIVRLEEQMTNNTEEIKKLSVKVESLSGKISNIMGNHINTLTKEVGELKATQRILIGIFSAVLVALISFIFK